MDQNKPGKRNAKSFSSKSGVAQRDAEQESMGRAELLHSLHVGLGVALLGGRFLVPLCFLIGDEVFALEAGEEGEDFGRVELAAAVHEKFVFAVVVPTASGEGLVELGGVGHGIALVWRGRNEPARFRWMTPA